MRLLLLTENYPPSSGGMAQSCDRLVSGFRSNNVEVDILHFTNHHVPFAPTQNINGMYIALPKHKDSAHGLNVALSYIEHHLDTQLYDYMLVFGGNLPVNAAPIYSKILGLDYYLCLRGNDFDISLFDTKRHMSLDNAVKQSKGVFVGSRDKIGRLNKLYPETPAYYAPNGIDLDDWQAFDSETSYAREWRKNHIETDKTVIGLIGFLKTKKGVRFFLDAVVRSNVKEQVHLMLSGEQPDEVLQTLSDKQIPFSQVPYLNRFELIKYLLVCDWVAIPSYYEGMPNVMLEAGGLGIPIIASGVDGMRDLISHKQDGFLFKPVDVKSCAKQINKAVNMTKEQRNTFGQALKNKISENYTPQTEIDVYLQTIFSCSQEKFASTKLSLLNTSPN